LKLSKWSFQLLNPVPNVQPPQLHNTAVSSLYGLEASVVGWGRLNSTLYNSRLKIVTMRIISNTACNERLRQLGDRTVRINAMHMLCALADPYALLNDVSSIFLIYLRLFT
jgi:hypothetical protein